MLKVSLAWVLAIYFLGGYVDVAESTTYSYLNFGCWRAVPGIRGIPSIEGTDPRLRGYYKARADAIQKCYEVARERNFEWFAVQDGGACYSSADAGAKVRSFGPSRLCRNGKGGRKANDIYMVVKSDDVCERGGYKKAGCFSQDRKLFSELLITDLDPSHHNWGEKIDWVDFQGSIHSLACRCEEKARAEDFSYFGIGFYGECWAGSNIKALKEKILTPGGHASSTCIGGDFLVCNDKNKHECAGIEDNEYVYLITQDAPASTTTMPATTLQPLPKTWRDYPYAMYKNKACKAKTWKPQGCFSASHRYQLLVYWRYDIEWSKNRMPTFASSFVCACAEAAKAANVKYFGTHFWGECWALKMEKVREASNADCTLADGEYQTKCHGNRRYDFECLGAKHYYMYSLV